MKKTILLILFLLLTITVSSQTIISRNWLSIKHDDITLYLTKDTLSLISKHKLKYENFLKINHERDDKWFRDRYLDKYDKKFYIRSGYDLGHLTPSDITSYDKITNHNSFSLFNQAPQLAGFNRGKWARLERKINDTISKYKVNSVIITGVIYDANNVVYLPNSKIKIPFVFYKIIFIDDKIYSWIGSNLNGEIVRSSLKTINELLSKNKMGVSIKNNSKL